MRWLPSDNTGFNIKITMRRKYLPAHARVLDLFCGSGLMYKNVYAGKVEEYLGIDKHRIHDENLCIKINNAYYVKNNDINKYNVFDLDDYGSPWDLFYLILNKYTGQEATFFITDGLKLHQNVDGDVTRWVSATEKIPSGMNIPGLSRWYVDIFATMLLDVQNRYNLKIINPLYAFNARASTCYWTFSIIKE